MSIFGGINYNKTFISTTMLFIFTITLTLLFFVSAVSHQTFAQDTFLTIKEALEKSFGNENGEESEERGYYKLKTGGEKERE
jgi:hypothetical protein